MSSCRCVEIKNCQHKIDKLKEGIASITTCDLKFDDLKSDLSQLTDYNQSTYENWDMTALNKAIQELDSLLSAFRDELKAKLQAKLAALEAELDELEEEDEDYHSEIEVQTQTPPSES